MCLVFTTESACFGVGTDAARVTNSCVVVDVWWQSLVAALGRTWDNTNRRVCTWVQVCARPAVLVVLLVVERSGMLGAEFLRYSAPLAFAPVPFGTADVGFRTCAAASASA